MRDSAKGYLCGAALNRVCLTHDHERGRGPRSRGPVPLDLIVLRQKRSNCRVVSLAIENSLHAFGVEVIVAADRFHHGEKSGLRFPHVSASVNAELEAEVDLNCARHLETMKFPGDQNEPTPGITPKSTPAREAE